MNTQVVTLTAIIVGIVLVSAVGVLLCRQFRISARRRELDTMDGFDFEYYCDHEFILLLRSPNRRTFAPLIRGTACE